MNKELEKEQLNNLVKEAEELAKIPSANLTLEQAFNYLLRNQGMQGPFVLAT